MKRMRVGLQGVKSKDILRVLILEMEIEAQDVDQFRSDVIQEVTTTRHTLRSAHLTSDHHRAALHPLATWIIYLCIWRVSGVTICISRFYAALPHKMAIIPQLPSLMNQNQYQDNGNGPQSGGTDSITLGQLKSLVGSQPKPKVRVFGMCTIRRV
jgi:hypothetical protein